MASRDMVPQGKERDEGSRRWGVLSDAHGNPHGLAACVATLEDAGAEKFVFLGDAVGYVPCEGAVLEQLRDLDAVCLAGNHEAMMLGRMELDSRRDGVYGLSAANARLTDSAKSWIAGWPETFELDLGDGAHALFVHGGPADPLAEYLYPDSDLGHCEAPGRALLVVGQTHRPFERRAGGTLVVNVGSCGLPRDEPGVASCGLLDRETREVTLFRVPFDASSLLRDDAHGSAIDPSVRRLLERAPER